MLLFTTRGRKDQLEEGKEEGKEERKEEEGGARKEIEGEE